MSAKTQYKTVHNDGTKSYHRTLDAAMKEAAKRLRDYMEDGDGLVAWTVEPRWKKARSQTVLAVATYGEATNDQSVIFELR